MAAAAAHAAGAEVIEVDRRDADVPLSEMGVRQAEAFGAWLRDVDDAVAPEVVWCSPYVRAMQTAQIAVDVSGRDLSIRVDERLRDRELGVLDLLTTQGVAARVPEEAARRQWLGKFFHRPPGGESWADVALRLRSLLRDLDDDHPDGRALVVAHDAVVLLIRYICERLTEAEVLHLSLTSTVANAAVTRLVRPDGRGGWTLDAYNISDHLVAAGLPVTLHGSDAEILPPSQAG